MSNQNPARSGTRSGTGSNDGRRRHHLGEDWDFIPYEGLDFRTKLPYCNYCESDFANTIGFNNGQLYSSKKNTANVLKKCVACKLVYYCSKECQKYDWKNHKVSCNTIKKQRQKVLQLEQETKLSLGRRKGGGDPSDDDNNEIGNYWNVAFPYVKAKYDLALLIHPSAYQTNIINSWKEMNNHLQELLRLTYNNNEHDYGLSSKFGFFLLHEGCSRDDDSYSFCCHMMHRWYHNDDEGIQEDTTTNNNGNSFFAFKTNGADNTKQGDWIYPKMTNCRYNNFFTDCPSNMIDEEAVTYYVIVWLIKKRLLSFLMNRMNAFRFVL